MTLLNFEIKRSRMRENIVTFIITYQPLAKLSSILLHLNKETQKLEKRIEEKQGLEKRKNCCLHHKWSLKSFEHDIHNNKIIIQDRYLGHVYLGDYLNRSDQMHIEEGL